MSKTINLPGYIIEGGGTFFGTPGDDGAQWGKVTTPAVIYLLGGNDLIGGGQAAAVGAVTTTITIFCGEGNDRVSGNDGNVGIFYGGKGNDMLSGYDKNDILYGDSDNDRLLGSRGNDTLFGGKGDDYSLGSDGDDFLVGGRGQNLVYGDDLTTAGLRSGGKDIFVIENFGQPGNYTNIMDFVDGEDKVGLANGLSFEELSIADRGSNLVISLRNSSEPLAIITKTVPGKSLLTVSSLTKDDFLSI